MTPHCITFFYRHCGFVVYQDQYTAEQAASKANGTSVLGGTIVARGPAEQRRNGHSGTYDGKIGYVPTKDNDRRPYTDCIHYVNGVCTNGDYNVSYIPDLELGGEDYNRVFSL